MGIIKHDEIVRDQIRAEGVTNTTGAKIIGPAQGWPDHTLRVFRVGPRGHTPHHQHDWEHVNYIISGKGRLTIGDVTHEVTQGDFAYVPPNTSHQFENPYAEDFEFICIVPNRGA
jgi:quercetin dioxygenase-like cupin family protein